MEVCRAWCASARTDSQGENRTKVADGASRGRQASRRVMGWTWGDARMQLWKPGRERREREERKGREGRRVWVEEHKRRGRGKRGGGVVYGGEGGKKGSGR